MAKRPAHLNGLGHEHRRRKAGLPPATGQPCPYCGKPMFSATQQLDADHAVPRALGGAAGPLRWAHSSCNRSAGATPRQQDARRSSHVSTVVTSTPGDHTPPGYPSLAVPVWEKLHAHRGGTKITNGGGRIGGRGERPG